MKAMTINLISLIKNNMKSTLAFLISFFIFLSSCKKKDSTVSAASSPTVATSSISPLLFTGEYGANVDDYYMVSNMLSYLSTNHLIISSVTGDASFLDKLQILKIDNFGGLVWQKTYNAGDKHYSGQAFETNTGDIIAIGGVGKPMASWTDSKVFIAKLNPANGDTIWTRKYGNRYIDHAVVGYQAMDNNYWILDFYNQDRRATLLKIAPNGDSLTAVFNAESSSPQYRNAIVTSNKKIVMVGESGVLLGSQKQIYICKYTDGAKDFSNSIPISGYDELRVNSVCESLDGGFVISGYCYNTSASSLRYGFLIRTDANGNKLWDRVLTQFNNSEIISVAETATNNFFLAIGPYGSGNGQLLNYDLTNLTPLTNAGFQPYADSQLLLKGTRLYRAMISLNSSFTGYSIKLKSHTVY